MKNESKPTRRGRPRRRFVLASGDKVTVLLRAAGKRAQVAGIVADVQPESIVVRETVGIFATIRREAQNG